MNRGPAGWDEILVERLTACKVAPFRLRGTVWLSRLARKAIALALTVGWLAHTATATFTVATYNLESYLDAAAGNRPPKADAARAQVQESVLAMSPDVLAVQEIGTTNALLELRASLKAGGGDYPYWEHVTGWDTNIFVAVLSRFPIIARRPWTNATFLLQGRRFHVSRGFAEVDIRVSPTYTFTLISAHLKSRRPAAAADEAELRAQEARLLRQKVEGILQRDLRSNVVVLGDFNDTQDSLPVKTILGTGRGALVDTRPAERNREIAPGARRYSGRRNITWTHFYAKEDSYQRVDYLLLSRAMAREWDESGTYVLALPNWGVGSDHRPVLARFFAEDR